MSFAVGSSGGWLRGNVKILHVTPSFHPASAYGGPSESVFHLCCALGRRGEDVRVLTTNANGDAVLGGRTDVDVTVDDASIRVRYCSRSAGESVSARLLSQLVPAIRWADVVHLHAVYSFPTLPTLLTCRTVGRPLVWSPRGALQRWPGSGKAAIKYAWETACRLTAPHRVLIHATSDDEAASCHRRLGFPTAVIQNGVVVPEQATHVDRKEFRLLYLGRLHPIKGLENLIRAVSLVSRDATCEWSLRIAGAGDDAYTAELEALIAHEHLSDRVRLLGHVPTDMKAALFANTDVLIAPSYRENFCLSIAEALAHGVPVIAGRGTPWERIEQIGCGLWVGNEPAQLAAAILQMVRADRVAQGRRARAWMRAEFDWTCIARRMAEVYANAVDAVGARSVA